MERVGETVVAVGTNDERFIILGENERSDRNCGDLVGKDREQMFNLSTVCLTPARPLSPYSVPLSVTSTSDDDLRFHFLRVPRRGEKRCSTADAKHWCCRYCLGIKIENMWNHLGIKRWDTELNKTRRSEKNNLLT